MRKLFYFVAAAAFVFPSCTSSEAGTPQADAQSQAFNRYLRYNFGDSIGEERHVYLVITKKSNRSIVPEKLRQLSPLLNELPNGTCTAILSADVPVADSLLPACHCITDWDATVDRLDLFPAPLMLVATARGRITELLRVSDMEAAKAFLKKE